MSRPTRAGTAGRPVTIRATPGERADWGTAAAEEGCWTLSEWVIKTLNARARKVINGSKK